MWYHISELLKAISVFASARSGSSVSSLLSFGWVQRAHCGPYSECFEFWALMFDVDLVLHFCPQMTDVQSIKCWVITVADVIIFGMKVVL